jgi:hypothetical protein
MQGGEKLQAGSHKRHMGDQGGPRERGSRSTSGSCERPTDSCPQVNALVKQGNALQTVGCFALQVPRPSEGRGDLQKPCSGGVWWAREELNLRPLPCQQNGGNRCARGRSPRSAPTVEAEGKRSVDVQGNALFGTPTPPLHVLLTSGVHQSLYEAIHRLDRSLHQFQPLKGCRRDQRVPTRSSTATTPTRPGRPWPGCTGPGRSTPGAAG